METVSVNVMQCAFVQKGTLRIDKIASGVGIIVFSQSHKTAAGIHVLRGRSPQPNPANPAYFADTGIASILAGFTKRDIAPPYSVAIAGGASMLNAVSQGGVGSIVVTTVKEVFAELNIPVKKESVGGRSMRSMVLNIDEKKLNILQYNTGVADIIDDIIGSGAADGF